MAEATCREALQRYPEENNLSCLLGAVLIRAQRAAEAEVVLRQVVERVPAFAKAHDELANALLAQNLPEQAVESLERTIELDPGNALASHKLKKIRAALDETGDPGHAGTPALDDTEAMLLEVEQLRSMQRFREAEKLCQTILASEPNNAGAYQRLAHLALEQQHFGDAKIFLQRAVSITADDISIWLDMATVCVEMESYQEAVAAITRAVELEPGAAMLHQLLGGALARGGQHEPAIAAYDTALALQADNAPALAGLGHALRTIGRQEEAVDAYRRLIDVMPGSGEAYWNLANLKSKQLGAEDIELMLQQVAQDNQPDDTRAYFCFALGQAFEDCGEYDRAFEFFARGNAIRRASETYDPVETQSATDRLIAVFDEELFAGEAEYGDEEATPIFIVGMPRSGSTLVEQILASHSQVAGTRELATVDQIVRSLDHRGATELTYPENAAELDGPSLRDLGDRYLRGTQPYRDDSPFFTDKMPNNFRNIGLIGKMLPHARIIDMRRHPLDSCMGCFKQLFASGQPFSYDLFELGEYYLEYARLMRHWQALLPDRILTVSYEDLVSDPEGQVERLLDFCGLPMQESCLNFHKTERPIESASSEQVRRPIYSTSVDHWRNYETHIAELISTLQPVLNSGTD